MPPSRRLRPVAVLANAWRRSAGLRAPASTPALGSSGGLASAGPCTPRSRRRCSQRRVGHDPHLVLEIGLGRLDWACRRRRRWCRTSSRGRRSAGRLPRCDRRTARRPGAGSCCATTPTAPVAVAKRDQVLAQQADRATGRRRARQLVRRTAPAASTGGTASPRRAGPTRVSSSFSSRLGVHLSLLLPASLSQAFSMVAPAQARSSADKPVFRLSRSRP